MASKTRDRRRGFTLLELFMIIIIIAILAFFGWRSYKISSDVAHETTLRLNMRTVQMAVKSYFDISDGTYPPSVEDPSFMSCFAGGSVDKQGTRAGNFPINPFTNRPEAPLIGHVNDVAKERSEAPKPLGEPGQIFYSPITLPGSEAVSSFAIQAAGRDGRSLSGPQANTSLVISNQ